MSGDTAEEMKSTIDIMKTYLEGLQETLDSVNGEHLRQELEDLENAAHRYETLEQDRMKLMNDIAELTKQEDEALRRGNEE